MVARKIKKKAINIFKSILNSLCSNYQHTSLYQFMDEFATPAPYRQLLIPIYKYDEKEDCMEVVDVENSSNVFKEFFKETVEEYKQEIMKLISFTYLDELLKEDILVGYSTFKALKKSRDIDRIIAVYDTIDEYNKTISNNIYQYIVELFISKNISEDCDETIKSILTDIINKANKKIAENNSEQFKKYVDKYNN